MTIKTLPGPCWYLVKAGSTEDFQDGCHDGTPHFDSRNEALTSHSAEIAKDRGVAVDAVPYDQPCHIVECNGCGQEPPDDEWGSTHWPTLHAAQEMAVHLDVVLVGARDVWCEDCKTDPHPHVGDPELTCDRCGNFADEHEPAEVTR